MHWQGRRVSRCGCACLKLMPVACFRDNKKKLNYFKQEASGSDEDDA